MIIKIKRNSWIVKFAEFGGMGRSESTTTCKLAAYILAGIGIVTVSTGVTVLVSISYGDFFAWIVAGLIHGFAALNYISSFAVVFSIFFITIFFCIAFQKITQYINSKKLKNTETNPSVVKILWDSFVKKVCTKVEYVD